MHAIAMIIYLGVSPAQMQAIQSAQVTPAVRYDLIRIEEQRAMTAERAREPSAKKRAELPSSMR